MNNDHPHIYPPNARRHSFTQTLLNAIHSFSITERLVFYVLVIIAAITGLVLLSNLNNRFLVAIPDYGGTITEGVIGIPRFVNPVLAISDADKDLTSLVFSGLIKSTPDGELVGDLAKEYSVSPDGRTYTFTLKDDISFHDGKPITTDDVEYTIQQIQNPTIKSPKRPVWDGVLINKIDSKNISFTLKQPYAPFLENFTVGIIPQHVWKDVPADEFSFSELNVNAVGEGPYKVYSVKRNSYGLSNSYSLRAFDTYSLGRPFVKNIVLNFYQTESDMVAAFKAGSITSMSGISPANLTGLDLSSSTVITSSLPRVFGVFYNQNQSPIFLNKEVREAFDVAVDKDKIVHDVLLGYGKVIDSPVPQDDNAISSPTATSTTTATSPTATSTTSRTDKAIAILTKGGWALNPKTGQMEKKVGSTVQALSFTLSTGDAPELKQAAELVKADWEKIGATVDLKVYEIGDLNQNVIRPRKYDVLLFGEVVGREFDLYPFWHSSQRNDPGLNIALYANITADKILESLRLVQDRDARKKQASDFEALFKTDKPATFIYSPDFIYVIPKALSNVTLGDLNSSGDRFFNVHEWYIETNKVWKFFAY